MESLSDVALIDFADLLLEGLLDLIQLLSTNHASYFVIAFVGLEFYAAILLLQPISIFTRLIHIILDVICRGRVTRVQLLLFKHGLQI